MDALAAVAAQGSFEQAAEKLGLTASAVSQRIRALEEETGFPLITRTRPCRPTVQGQKLLRYIRSLEWLEREGVPGHVETTEHGTLAHSEVNRKRSACFFCAMLRRKPLS